jgi:hypothetical protein
MTAVRQSNAARSSPRSSPEAMARLEQRAWQAYYERRWPMLGRLLFRITREQIGLPLWRALYPAYLAARAQIVFARRENQGGVAEAYMRRFYEQVRRAKGSRYDPARAAAAELRWWVVHRHRADYPDTTALVDALADLYAELYQRPADAVRPAAHHRAEAMELSDRWVRDGKDPRSPLLGEIRAELAESYRLLTPVLTS